MLRSLFLGYGLTLAAAFLGFEVLGGSVWLWLLAVWIGGAAVTLAISAVRTVPVQDEAQQRPRRTGSAAAFNRVRDNSSLQNY